MFVLTGKVLFTVGLGMMLTGLILMRPYQRKYRLVSPMCTLMDAKRRTRFKRYVLLRVSGLAVAMVAVPLWFGMMTYLPMLIGVYGFMSYTLARAFYKRWTAFMRRHVAFDGGPCSPEDLMASLAAFYARHQLPIEAVYGTDYHTLLLTVKGDGSTGGHKRNQTFTLKTPMPVAALASVVQVLFRPVGIYGFNIDMAGDEPVCTLITNPPDGEEKPT